jgi:hypothetical protein
LWLSASDGGRWGGLFRSGNDAWEIAYGDGFDEFNGPTLAEVAAKGLGPVQIWLTQWGGAARWGGLFRSGNLNYSIHYGDDFATFSNNTISSEISQGRAPVQIWNIFGDDGAHRWGGLFQPSRGPWEIVWADVFDYFNGTRLNEMSAKGLGPVQVWSTRQGNDTRWGGIFQAGTAAFEIVYGDSFDEFNNSRFPELNAKGFELSQFWTIG